MRKWLGWLGAGAWYTLTALVCLALALGGVGIVGLGGERVFHAFDSLDPSLRCERRQMPGCFSSTRAVVEITSSTEGADIAARYDDGRSVADLDLQGRAKPAEGTRVDLEFWRGHMVAVYDRVSERRYRTTAWPQKRISLAKGVGTIAAGLLSCVPAAVWLVRRGSWLVRRWTPE